MSALSSSSTLTEIKNAYLDNASYEEDGSTSKAAAFITACRMLLAKLPKRALHGGRNEIELDLGQIRKELDQAKTWLATSSTAATGGGVRFNDFTSFRS